MLRLGVMAALALTACTQPNHLGNPLTLPVRGLAIALENASYDRQRHVVKTYLTKNTATLRAENFQGPAADALLATLPESNREKVRQELRDAARHADFAERGTVIVMVHRG